MNFEWLIPIAVVGMLFIGLPWLFLHYMTQWRRSRGLSMEDEQLLDQLHDTARRLDERLCSIERIIAVDNPRWREECAPAVRAPEPNPIDRRH